MTKQPKYYSLRSFLSYMRQYRGRFALVMSSFVVANVALAIIPIFIGRLIGALAAHPIQGHQAVINVWILIGLSTTHNLVWRISELLNMKFINPLSYRYETILFERIITKPYPYFTNKFTGKLSSYITSISDEMKDFFNNLTYEYTSQVVSLIAIVAILTNANWQTGLIFVIGIVTMFIVGKYSIRNSVKYEKRFTDIQSTKRAKIIDAIANFVNVKSFGKEATEIAVIDQQQDITIAAANRSYKWTVFFWAIMSLFVRDIIWPATIILNVYLYLHHELSLAELTTILSTLLLFTATIWDAVWFISQFTLKLARIEEAHRYLFGPINLVKQQQAEQAREARVRPLKRGLELRKLNFAYPDKKSTQVLRDISLTLRKGEKIGIVGQSGSGKSTLTKLLLGYYPFEEQQLLLDGQPVDTRDLGHIISYVPQDTSLFHRTVAENIAYASDNKVSRADIVRAAKQAHADEFIAQISDGYDALVGERGVKLSAGQRQRIAIARAFLDDKPILILDEATSALDSESEILVQEALEALWEHKTVIAIAHRLSTLRHMDRILVMHQGQIVEQGSHEELLKARGRYAKLWNHQSGGFIEE